MNFFTVLKLKSVRIASHEENDSWLEGNQFVFTIITEKKLQCVTP